MEYYSAIKRDAYDPGILLLAICPEKATILKYTCTPMFIIALFTIARTWKKSRCPSGDKWIKKMWYIYNGLLVIKKNELESVLVMCMNLEPVAQSAVSQKNKNKHHMLTHIYGI